MSWLMRLVRELVSELVSDPATSHALWIKVTSIRDSRLSAVVVRILGKKGRSELIPGLLLVQLHTPCRQACFQLWLPC